MLQPKLRFKTFNDKWNIKQLREVLEFKNGINASKEQYGKGIKFINVLDILNNDFITYDNIIGRVNIDKNLLEKYSVSYGDILFQRSSETREEVGMANVYLDKNKIATFGGFIIRGKKIGSYEPYFMNKLLQTNLVRNEIISKAGGSTRYNVGQDILSEVKIIIPSIQEQKKIADFLSAVDVRIDLTNQKLELLEKYKKGIMQKIFNQELRFKDKYENNYPKWEEKKIEELFKITRGYVLAKIEIKDIRINDYIYPVFSSQTLNNGLMGFYNKYLFENCITWTTDGANAGTVKFRKGKFYCTNVCGVLISDTYNNNCISEILGLETPKHVSYVGNPKLMNNIMSKIKITIPISLEEQQKIADFLSSIDNKIEKLSSKLEELKEFKKGLLQQMFV